MSDDLIYAQVVSDSISPDGVRLTSVLVRFHRFVLSEVNTHRRFSRNSASSRAIPRAKMLERLFEETAFPIVWASEQPGMSGGEEIENTERARELWLEARDNAAVSAKMLGDLGVHKSITNRLIEPFMMHTALISSTEWDNFFRQRISPNAMPEIRAAAERMFTAFEISEPVELPWFGWHAPFFGLNPDDKEYRESFDALKLSAARCARTSYMTHDGVRDIDADLRLYEATLAKHGHWSPMEHVAVALPVSERHHRGNFDRPWFQLRQFVEAGHPIPTQRVGNPHAPECLPSAQRMRERVVL